MVLNVEVEVVTDVSVSVSWDSLDIPKVTGYTVYYNQTRNGGNEQSVNVTNSTNFVVINNLINNVEYQFQVAAIAELDGILIVGERSIVVMLTLPTKSSSGIIFMI